MVPAGLKTTARILLALGGGYWASSASFALLARVLTACGMPRVDAVTLGMMLVFILYLCLILWVFAARRVWLPFWVFCGLIAAGHMAPFFFTQGH